MNSAADRRIVYERAAQYYYTGSSDYRPAIYNKTKQFVDKLAGFLMQPTDVRFNITFDSGEPDSVLERAQLVGEKLSADFRQTDADVIFAEQVVWSLVNGIQLLKVRPDGESFHVNGVHPQNFGVLSETTVDLDQQEAFCHESYPSVTRLHADLVAAHHPRANQIIEEIDMARRHEREGPEPSYLQQMIVGGDFRSDTGIEMGRNPEASGIVNIFPVATPFRPSRKFSPTVRHCELWVQDADRDGDWTTIQMIYPDLIIEGETTRRNLSRIPGRTGFKKLQAQNTPGYFWGRSIIADVSMLQDILTKRLRDLVVMWNRNVAAPHALTGFMGITDEIWMKLLNEGGFIADPNAQAKAQKLVEPPPPGYLEELKFVFELFDEASGFSPIMSGSGEPGVRAGVHAQTLVRTSAPRLIDQAARIERQLAETGWLALRIMQAMDPYVYRTESGIEFILSQLPGNLQVNVDSHSASPAFAEDNRQLAIALARAGAVDAEDLIHMLHPPSADLLLARLRQRQKAQAQAAQAEKKEELVREVLGLGGGSRGGSRGGRSSGGRSRRGG